jgi:branched-chain amino acid transport system substrate-binding protein
VGDDRSRLRVRPAADRHFRRDDHRENPDVEIVEQQWPELGESDLDPFITSLLGSGAEAVYSPLFAGDLVTFTRQAHDLGFFDGSYFTALYETDALAGARRRGRPRGGARLLALPLHDRHPADGGLRRALHGPLRLGAERLGLHGLRRRDAVGAGRPRRQADASGQAFADTVGGFEFTSLRGDTYIRDVDHQAAVGSYISELTWSDEFEMYIYETAEPVPAEDIWLSEDEVLATRG